MTTVYQEKEACRICGTISDHVTIGPTKSFGSSDLDTRPPQMLRSTLKFQIRRCPGCGYCAPDLADASALVVAIVKSDAYRAQLDHPGYSMLANSFLCYALIQQAVGALDQAGWACLSAAWVCDDEQAHAPAKQCRLNAIHWFQHCKLESIAFTAEPGLEEAVLADLYRRTGQFERVPAICQRGIAQKPTAMILQMLNFQLGLARKQDTACHLVDQAL